jgi:hypothetical protein
LAPIRDKTFVTRTEQIARFLKDHHLQAWLVWRPDELFGGGARIEDNVLVTEAGHEVVSRASEKEP